MQTAEQRWTQVDNWLTLQPGHMVGNFHGIAQTSDGRIWIQNAAENPEAFGCLRL